MSLNLSSPASTSNLDGSMAAAVDIESFCFPALCVYQFVGPSCSGTTPGQWDFPYTIEVNTLAWDDHEPHGDNMDILEDSDGCALSTTLLRTYAVS
eukprot:6476499-Amphidinium_carterae.2